MSSGFIFFFAALGGLLFGYDIASVSGALLFITKDFNLTAWQSGWVVSSVLVGAILGALFTGHFNDKYGRKKVLIWSSIIFLIGALGSAFSFGFGLLVVSRILLGIGVGITSALIPAYLNELAPKNKRGFIANLFPLVGISGILLAYILNFLLAPVQNNWRWMLGFAAIPALILFLGALFLPESPRFLVKIGKNDEALQVLKVINKNNGTAANDDFKNIQEQAKQPQGGWKELFGKVSRPALITGLGAAIFQQIIGSNTVIFYAPTIFTNIGLGVYASLLSTIGIGIVNLIAMSIATYCMDKLPRKLMLIIGGSGMGIALLVMGTTLKFATHGLLPGIISVISCTVYVAFYCFSWSGVTWVLIGEVFPLNIRGLGASLCSSVNWIANMLVSVTFPTMLATIGLGYSFIFYAVICVIAVWVCHAKFMETKGKSLEEIEDDLRKQAGVTGNTATNINPNIHQ